MIDVDKLTRAEAEAMAFQLIKEREATNGAGGKASSHAAPATKPRKPTAKVGTALAKIFAAVDIHEEMPAPAGASGATCVSCRTMRQYLDQIGLEWCKNNQRQIADYVEGKAGEYMKAKSEKFMGAARAWAALAARAVSQGIVVDPRDLYFNIVGRAIRTAAAELESELAKGA